MNPIAAILEQFPLVVLDGALATELEARGCDLRDSLWSARVLLEQPELIRQVHADYLAAGADVLITASYQATFEGFAARGLTRAQAADLMHLSVGLAAEARDEFWANAYHRVGRPQPLVAASVGPYGAYLADGSEYRGDYDLSEDALVDFHRPRMHALVAAGPDLLACETIPTLVEARALLRLLDESPGVHAWISFSARDGAHTSRGEPIAECAAEVGAHPQVAAVGINCTAPRYMADLITAVRGATDKPVVVYPNSGEVFDAASMRWHGRSECDTYAADAVRWYAAGARLIGGCCRTTPAHIRALADRIRI